MNIKIVVLITVIILLIPFIAMQFTAEVDWDRPDFVVAGLMLFGVGLLIEFARVKLNKSKHKAAVITLIVIAFLLTWVELAVGILGSPWAGS